METTTLLDWISCFRVTPEPEREPGPRGGGGNGGFFSLIGLFLVLLLLWRWGGPVAFSLGALVAAGIYLWTKTEGTGPGAAYRELVKLCKDTATAERLIAGELGRNPALSRKQAVREALARYRRDLGR